MINTSGYIIAGGISLSSLSMKVNKFKVAIPMIFGCAYSSLCIAENIELGNPNVIFIMADDIGYSDFGCYGATKIETPHIDQLAKKGIIFTQAHSPASTSSPSRYALLTGEYAWRKNIGVLPADAPLTITSETNTIAKLFKSNGYNTGMVGKWHLGLGSAEQAVDFNTSIEKGPNDIGFDYAYYFPATNDRVPCIYIENKKVDNYDPSDSIVVSYKQKVGNDPTGKESPELLKRPFLHGHSGTIVNGISRIGWMSGGNKARWVDENMSEQLTKKALSYIENNQKSPFFLYFATHNAHEPRVVSEQFKGSSDAGLYGDIIQEFDHMVGLIIKKLKQLNLYDNTIIIVTSDNGPMIKEGYIDGALENINGHNPYGVFRGQKYELHEAGTRVPFIYSHPQSIKKPFKQTAPFCYLDMLATFSDILKLPTNNLNDSKSARAIFENENCTSYRDYVLTQNNSGNIAIRSNGWKYIPAYAGKDVELYNLINDPSELRNVAMAYPDIVKQMQQFVTKDKLQ